MDKWQACDTALRSVKTHVESYMGLKSRYFEFPVRAIEQGPEAKRQALEAIERLKKAVEAL